MTAIEDTHTHTHTHTQTTILITTNIIINNCNLLESPKMTTFFFPSKFEASFIINMSDMAKVCCVSLRWS